ncbi:TolC family protein [Aromatoleum bremense]|uniref:Transporter n=1 Tax=Aromatoleum bremense TaxID=76115 RepID=A0ABX1NX78_9RHOO|nr:TolC family protein [Aromatoleum bremense]NMG16624.1 transporter [Aromatoleum bremense]
MNARSPGAPKSRFPEHRFHAPTFAAAELAWTKMSRSLCAVGTLWLVGLASTGAVAAQSAADAAMPTIRLAVEAAWSRSAAGRAAGARRDALAARRDAAASWTPEPPSMTVSQRSDRFNRNDGMRELEAELEVPLWMPGTRAAAAAVAAAEGDALDAGLERDRLDIAGEVREAVWSLRLAQNDIEANRRRVAEAEALAADVQRRVDAGELARIDANGARAALQQARAAQAEAESRLAREQRLFRALTGLTEIPADNETAPADSDIDRHPALVGWRRAADAARARVHEANAATRDAPELIVGFTRERGEVGARYENTTTIGVRVPFGTDARNRPRIGAANAEWVEAEALAAQQRERLLAERDAARDELEQARRVVDFAAERARLAADTQQLLAKAFDLGEIDLPTRLRAENERFDAELALGRARLELARAASRLNQASGLLP